METINIANLKIYHQFKSNETSLDQIFFSGLGYQNIPPGSTYPTSGVFGKYDFNPEKGRCIDDYQLIYIVHGNGYAANPNGKYDVHTGSLILVRPGEWHTYYPNHNTGWTEYFISFRSYMIGEYIEKKLPKSEYASNVFEVGLRDDILNTFQNALIYASINEDTVSDVLASSVRHIVALTKYCLTRKGISDTNEIRSIYYAKVYMMNNLEKKINLDELSRQLGMSYPLFRKKFKIHTGLQPSRYLQKLRINRSKELLCRTDYQIKKVSLECGFASPEYFCNVFKEATGITPLEYRENNNLTETR